MLVDMDLHLGYDVFDRVVADVRNAVDTLEKTRRRAAGDVGALLDGGWTGAAAGSFAAAWQEWLAGADQVQAALGSVVASLETSRRGVTAADASSAERTRHLLERLG